MVPEALNAVVLGVIYLMLIRVDALPQSIRTLPSGSASVSSLSSKFLDTSSAVDNTSTLPIFSFSYIGQSATPFPSAEITHPSSIGTRVRNLQISASLTKSIPGRASTLVYEGLTFTLSSGARAQAAPTTAPSFSKSITTDQASTTDFLRLPSERPPAHTPSNVSTRCGPVSLYYHSTANDWINSGVGPWLDGWWTTNRPSFAANGGFAGLFGADYLGNPNWKCKDDGSSDCSFDPCNQPVLNSAGTDVAPAYMVLHSTQNLHSYYQGLSQSFQVSAIFAAFSKDDWAYKFYRDKSDYSKTSLKEIINAVTGVVGIVSAFAAPFTWAVKAVAGAANALFAAGINGAKYALEDRKGNDTPIKAARLGAELAQAFMQSIMNVIGANDQLMAGESFHNTGDIRAYLADGAFLNFGGVDKTMVINKARDMLQAVAINYLYKQQKIFILGGGPCDDSGNLGEGPQEAKLCVDGKAWYLFFWREYGGIHWFSKKEWGNVDAPPGFDFLGKNDLSNITVQDIIASSLSSYKEAGLNYTYDRFLRRTQDTLQQGLLNPSDAGPHWEGVFSIPVCNISAANTKRSGSHSGKSITLQPYGKIPQWCTPICTNSSGMPDAALSRQFLIAAKMQNFASPTVFCNHDSRTGRTGWNWR